MDGDIPLIFEFCETARFRLNESPGLAARAKLLERRFRNSPLPQGRDVVDGALRYKVFKMYVWCYMLTREEDAVRCTIMTIEPYSQPDLEPRLARAVWAGLQEFNPFAKAGGAMAEEWNRSG
ncbi:MAG: hypothetical protein AAGK30_03140 [Pseudomonadota bacterium]